MMSNRIKVLFVCSKNRWRSPTAEAVYRDDHRIAVRSRGTAQSARRTVCAADLAWADLVMVMEHKHRSRLLAEFTREAEFLEIAVLDIPDDYQFMDAELVDLIQTAAEPHIDQAGASG
ncbi:MAG: phosphotyrosine protein phosphatase [Aureliella sp.]